MSQLVFLDLETTGLDPALNGIVEIAAVFVDEGGKKASKKFESLANPLVGMFRGREVQREVTISDYALTVNGITKEVLTQQKSIDRVLMEFDSYVENKSIIAGWNVATFDMPFLKAAYTQADIKWRFHHHVLDLMCVAKWLQVSGVLPGNRGVGLQAMAKYLGVKPRGDAHRALPDVFMAMDIASRLREDFLIGRSYKI